jgi:hypothetical protein
LDQLLQRRTAQNEVVVVPLALPQQVMAVQLTLPQQAE